MKKPLILHCADLMKIEKISHRTAQRRMAQIKKHYKINRRFITTAEYCSFAQISREHVWEAL